MVLVFFDMKGILYTNCIPKGKTVNAKYVYQEGPGKISDSFQREEADQGVPGKVPALLQRPSPYRHLKSE
jgi:hypothetical protein